MKKTDAKDRLQICFTRKQRQSLKAEGERLGISEGAIVKIAVDHYFERKNPGELE